MKYPFRLIFFFTFSLILFGCSEKTELAPSGGDTNKPSSDASLSDLTISGGTLTPEFDPSIEAYTVSVPNDINSITVTPNAADESADIEVNGTSVSSGSSITIPLPIGDTVINIVVTAEDGTKTIYTVTVTREDLTPPVVPPSTDSSLSNLTLSEGTLTPGFSSDILSYTASVTNDVASITVTPTATDANAEVTVNGIIVASGSASQSIALSEGENAINVLVTAEDGMTKSAYVVSVNRASLNTDSSLSNLTLSEGTLTPGFSSDILSYTASVTNDVASITVTPTATDANATISVNGTAVASGTSSQAIPLGVGDNTISIVVTAEDGNTTTYVITVNRAALPVTEWDKDNWDELNSTWEPVNDSAPRWDQTTFQ